MIRDYKTWDIFLFALQMRYFCALAQSNGKNNSSLYKPLASGKAKLGNWTNYVTKSSGTTTLDQSRAHNKANEIAGNGGSPITETTGPSWAQPVYDDNGNQTAGPHPGDETSKNSYVYDAWNRLTKVEDSTGSTIATYTYNALGWRVSKTLGPASSENGAVYNYYYNANWQVLEVDKTPPSSPTYTYKQYVWSLRYIDAPVCRFRDTNADGTLDETLYYAEDANFNVTALMDTTGSVVERYNYSAYGKVSVYGANWTARTSSSYDNTILFGGYRYDSQSGLYSVRHRMYNPSLGRWLQRDPFAYVDGLNLYAYASSNPITLLDAMGLCSCGGGGSGSGWFSWFKNVTVAIGKGIGQGVLNTVNGVQDIGVGLANAPGSLYNASAGRLGLGSVPSIPSPDWSKGAVLDKSTYHDVSKFLGGNGAVGLATVGLSTLGKVGVGLTTPGRYFGRRTAKEVSENLTNKYGSARSTREGAETFYNSKSQRSYNVHIEPDHGPPHVDIRRRGSYQDRKYLLKEPNQ